jgi:sialate O-acetylesterase
LIEVAESFRWPEGYSCAVSLTYDDGLAIHCEHVGPLLEAHGLRGTFYLHMAVDPSRNPERWRALGARGHELGNHTLFHPCRRYPRSRHPWLKAAYDLQDYTPDRLRTELRLANAFLNLIDGRSERTFAYTCFDLYIGRLWNRRFIGDIVRSQFVAARGSKVERPVTVSDSLDLMRVGCQVADGRPFETLRDWACAAQNQGGWLVLVIHGVGRGAHGEFVEREAHEALVRWLAEQKQIWVRPFIEVAKWVRGWQTGTDPSIGADGSH